MIYTFIIKSKPINNSLFVRYSKDVGFELPGCGKSVTVPTSIKPKPRAQRQSIKSPFLSKPATVPKPVRKI